MNTRAIKEITDFIFMDDTPAVSDVILIPGSPNAALAERAAALYREGFAPYVLPSGRFSYKNTSFADEQISGQGYEGEYATEFAFLRDVLIQNGVPATSILCEDRATNTVENGLFSAEVLKARGICVKRAILCTQAFHARRAFLSYGCFFGDAELLVVPVETQGISSKNWYGDERAQGIVMGELEKCGAFFAKM